MRPLYYSYIIDLQIHISSRNNAIVFSSYFNTCCICIYQLLLIFQYTIQNLFNERIWKSNLYNFDEMTHVGGGSPSHHYHKNFHLYYISGFHRVRNLKSPLKNYWNISGFLIDLAYFYSGSYCNNIYAYSK